MTKRIKIYDATLRDGNHRLRHQISPSQIADYATHADRAGVDYIEVGHGNGLGASSYLIGKACCTDQEMIRTAVKSIRNCVISVFVIPGFATQKDILDAIENGARHVRIGVLSTEHNLAFSYIDFCLKCNISCEVALMMIHLLDPAQFGAIINDLHKNGIKRVCLMDSSGNLLPKEVVGYCSSLPQALKGEIELGFHAHNNLGLAVGNALAACESGCCFIDATILGLGGGSGNLALEQFTTVAELSGLRVNTKAEDTLRLADQSKSIFGISPSCVDTINVAMAKNGLFGGFQRKIEEHAKMSNTDIFDFISLLSNYKPMPGQEYLIERISMNGSRNIKNHSPHIIP